MNITNSYKYVILKRTSGSIIVQGSSSPIEVTQIKNLPKEGQVELITTYKPILLHIPKSANVIISASTRYGKINSDFPVYLDKEDKNKIRATQYTLRWLFFPGFPLIPLKNAIMKEIRHMDIFLVLGLNFLSPEL